MPSIQCEKLPVQTATCAQLRDELTGALIGLARATEGNDHMVSVSTAAVTVEGLAAMQDNAEHDSEALRALIERADIEKRKLVPECYRCAASCGRTNNFDMQTLKNENEESRSLKYRILSGICDAAVFAHRAAALGRRDETVHSFLYRALFAIGRDDWGMGELLPIHQEISDVKRKCVAMLE